MRTYMHRSSLFIGILSTALVLLFGATAHANSINLTIDNGGSIADGGVYVGPYNFTTGSGQSLQLICDTFENEVYPPESWTANIETVVGSGVGTGITGLSTNSTQYEEIAWLAQQMFLNINNSTTVAEIQWALWDILDPTASTTDPYGTPSNPAAIQGWLTAATTASNYATGNYSDVVIYTPAPSSWPSGYTEPQEYIGIVNTPEPGTISLMLIALGSLGLMMVMRKRISLRHSQSV